MVAENTERRGDWKSNLLERLHDPVQLRIGVIAVVFLLGYVAIYTPLSDQIAVTTKRLNRDRNLLALAAGYEQLQKQYRTFADRVPQQTDMQEWIKCVLEGTRQFTLNVSKLNFRDTVAVGPYRAVALQIEVDGSYADISKFLEWLETNRRFFRANDIRLAPMKTGRTDEGGNLTMGLTVLGMTG